MINNTNSLKYRPEIDGLRALAVIPVVFFHAGFKWIEGGFVGVDIFFVISGYLITSILIDDLRADRFSIARFYERRARRILPALFFVMLCSLPIAWWLMIPSQLFDFSNSLTAVSLFASNFFFWHETGYFATDALEKPLLHTWSLAVEEQYYVIFPIFLFLAWRYFKKYLVWSILVITIFSFALSEKGLSINTSATFYFTPTRAWELLAGVLAAFSIQKWGIRKNNIISIGGIAMILASMFLYDSQMPFPGIYALPPVLGTFCVIVFADQDTFATKLLSLKPMVAIGLISYSAYLWHYPLFSFAYIYTITQMGDGLKTILILTTLIMGWISWRFVESPFRKKTFLSRRAIFIYSGIGMTFFIIIGIIGNQLKGDVLRYNAQDILLAEAIREWGHPGKLQPTDINGLRAYDPNAPIDILFFGDSHAEQYAPAIEILSEKYSANIATLTGGGCPPLPNVFEDRSHQHCYDLFERLDTLLAESPSLSHIVIAGCFNCYFIEQSKPKKNSRSSYYFLSSDKKLYFQENHGQAEAMNAFVNYISRFHPDKKVLIILDNPISQRFDPQAMLLHKLRGDTRYFVAKYKEYADGDFEIPLPLMELNSRFLQKLNGLKGVSTLDMLRLLCPDGLCRVKDQDNRPIYRDANHIRPSYVTDNLVPVFENHLFPETTK